jgi:hypothetical protein
LLQVDELLLAVLHLHHGVAMAEGAALHILTSEAHGLALHEQRSVGEQLGEAQSRVSSAIIFFRSLRIFSSLLKNFFVGVQHSELLPDIFSVSSSHPWPVRSACPARGAAEALPAFGMKLVIFSTRAAAWPR